MQFIILKQMSHLQMSRRGVLGAGSMFVVQASVLT